METVLSLMDVLNMTTATPSLAEPPAKRVLWRYAAGVVAASLMPFVFWPSLLTKAISSNFLPHRFCYLNSPGLVWTNVVSDTVIGLSYIAISATLALLVHRTKRDIPFSWMFLSFGLFIVACAGTHLMETVTVWVPVYWLSADVKIVTALASFATAISLPRLVPKTISLLTASKAGAEQKLQLEAANTRLTELERMSVQLSQRAAAGLAYWELDYSTGRVQWWGDVERLFGREQSRLRTLGLFLSCVHPDDRDKFQSAVEPSFLNHEELDVEFRIVTPEGKVRWLLGRGQPHYDDRGNPVAMVSVSVDVTELRRTQDATARLAALVEGSEDAIIAYRLDGVLTDWNQAAARLYGYSAEEAIGQNVSILVPSGRAHELAGILKTVAAGKRIQQFETVRQKKDGSLVEVSFSVSPIAGQNGTIIGGSSIIRDITSRKRMEEALRRSEERFRLVARATRDAISDWDIASGVLWRSESFWEHFGYPAKEAEPDVAAWKNLIHPEDRNRVWSGLQTELARHADSYEVEYRFRRADDSYAIVLDRAYIVYGESGEPARAVSTMTDLSDRRELEEQFRQAQKMEAVGRLAGGIAHDFNNLLMVISGCAEMMREEIGPEGGLHKNLAQVLKAAATAAALTQQLLAFSRKQVLSPRIIDLNAVVEDSVNIIKRLIGEDVELKVSLGQALGAVKADPSQMVQVLLNLCVNARDAMPNGGRLTIATENVSIDLEAARKRPAFVPGNYAALVVSDTGTGMTAEARAHIFEPFFTTKELGKGTGLGLSTVYGIIKQSGGYIWVDSDLGRGSSFSLYFPTVDAPLAATVTPEINNAEGQGEIILLVEDEAALRESISTYLNLHGYKVLEASDGAQAVHIASQHRGSIHVLVTDMILPKLSGAELAREVAKTCPNVVTLYVSGYTDRELVDYDPARSTAGFLQKPFALPTLLQKLREMIAKRG